MSAPEITAAHGTFHQHGRDDTAATLGIVERDKPARVRRAVLTLAATWGCAVLAVFIPLLHFILVPGLLLAGPLLAFQKLGERVTILSANGACPACAAAQTFTLSEPARERIALRCNDCGRALDLRPEPALFGSGTS